MEYLQDNPKLTEPQVKVIFKQIFSGIDHLHNHLGIAHRDIKFENFMVTSLKGKLRVKLIDYGLSKLFVPSEVALLPAGTVAYCSPEIVLNEFHDKSADIWSLGVMLYSTLFRQMPFVANHRDDKQAVMNKIVSDDPFINPYINLNTVSEASIDLLTKMLCKFKLQRLTIKEILSHRWFSSC